MTAIATSIESWMAGFGRDGRQMLLVLLAVACIAIPHIEHLPVWATLIATTAFVVKVSMVRARRPVPSSWLLSAMACAVTGATLVDYHTVVGRDAGVTLLVMLMCTKLLELRARRDIFVVICLGYFVALCQFLYSQSIPTAALVALGVLALLTAQIAQNLDGDPSCDAPPSMRVAFRIALRVLGYAVPLTVALFVLFPRLPGPLWGQPGDAPGATGMSDTMSPGSMSSLAESDAIAFRVRFEGPAPAPQARYFRGIVLEAFDGRTWRPGVNKGRYIETPFADPTVQSLAPPLRYTVTQEPHDRRWLFVLDMPVDAPRPTDRRAMQVRANHDLTYSSVDAVRERIRIDGVSAPQYRLLDDPRRIALGDTTELPPGFNPRTLRFALDLRRQSDDPATLIRTVLTMFRTRPFRYTLTPPVLGKHSVDEFLFDTRAGFCEHYASSFVVLMRALGVPARVVTGYQGGEINPQDGYLEVRQRDAHAWAEVWLGRANGWVRVDPTAAVAPERVERGAERVLPLPGLAGVFRLNEDNMLVQAMRAVRDRWSAVENSWNQWVLHYDTESQQSLLRRFGFDEPNWRNLMLGAVGAFGLISALMALRVLWRRPKRDALLRTFDRFEAKLARAGIERAPHEPPHALAERVRRELDETYAARASRIIDAFVRLRYGNAADAAAQTLTHVQLKRWIAEFRL